LCHNEPIAELRQGIERLRSSDLIVRGVVAESEPPRLDPRQSLANQIRRATRKDILQSEDHADFLHKPVECLARAGPRVQLRWTFCLREPARSLALLLEPTSQPLALLPSVHASFLTKLLHSAVDAATWIP
jgi:hypothetical protein